MATTGMQTEAAIRFDVPQDACCNCGGSSDLSIIDTPLKKTRFMLLGGTELTITAGFPYCSGCANSSMRLPTGHGSKVMVAFGVFWVLMLLTIFFMPATLSPGPLFPLALGVIALILTYGAYGLRRARAPKTSYTQPVTLTGVKQKFSGEIIGISLGFSNAGYKSAFDALNSDLIGNGVLTTE